MIAERLNHQVTEDDARINAARERFTESDRRAERLHDIADRIRLPEVEPPPTAAPWTESPDAAAARADELLRDIAEADREVTRTKNALNDLRARILRWSGDFPTVPVEVTSRFRSEGVIDELGPEARIWRDKMTVRADELDIDLRELEEHRTNVITRAIGMVNDALGDLDRFSRLSEMPEELGEAWGGRKFVEVHVRPSVDRCEPSCVTGSAARWTGSWMPAPSRAAWTFCGAPCARWSARHGLHGPRAEAVADVLDRAHRDRPDAQVVGRREGHDGTAAVRDRREAASREPWPASWPVPVRSCSTTRLARRTTCLFLELQRAVAAAAGVQLVFLTGVADMKAVGLFPCVVRMRNAPDQGRTTRLRRG